MAELPIVHHLQFFPLPGMGSSHIQTILPTFLPAGNAPPSTRASVTLDDGDMLYIFISTPLSWNDTQKTVVLLHGLGGDYTSDYMVRISRKLFQAGHRVVRVNMRSAGVADAETRRPYHAGVSHDVYAVVKQLKKQAPQSTLIVIGFSLGGNMVLKLAGELGAAGEHLMDLTIAVCPPIDLASTSSLICSDRNSFYNTYYTRKMSRQVESWTLGRSFDNIYEFDNMVTAPIWGFRDAADYYRQSSSRYVLKDIQDPCYLLFAEDDPFVDYTLALENPLPECVEVMLTKKGGHVGFVGWTKGKSGVFWLDEQLLQWVDLFKKVGDVSPPVPGV